MPEKQHTRNLRVLLTGSILLSLLGHGLAALLIERSGAVVFDAAISEPAVVLVNITKENQTTASPKTSTPASQISPAKSRQHRPALPKSSEPAPLPEAPDPLVTQTLQKKEPQHQPALSHAAPSESNQLQVQQNTAYLVPDQIVAVQKEKLVYQIKLAGVPVGSAQLEATNHQGELRILTSIRSNSIISAFYPVHNTTDTRLIKGRYLLTRIRQNEGLFVSDTGFNLMFHERKIFWVDRLKNRYSNEPLEALDTLDFVSGFYFLRLQPLKVGETVSLKLYDGDTTSNVPVSVLRQETLSLNGMQNTETLVIQPHVKESGFFKNNRDLLVWFTNDVNRMPVRIEATTPIGRIAAELVSSERITFPLNQD